MSALAERRGKVDPLLLPDRDEPYELHDVLEKVIDGCRDEIVLSFGDSYLSFKALPDTDEIAARFHARKFTRRGFGSIGHDTPWRRFVSENCGWTWLAVNQQGYWDTALISFDAVVPNVLLNVMGSSIFVFSVGPMDVSWRRKSPGALKSVDPYAKKTRKIDLPD
jgi:hypothetical protein